MRVDKTYYRRFKQVLILTLLGILSFNNMFAQFDGQYSQYMFNRAIINPAAVGEQELMKATVLQRMQWLGVRGAPVTTSASAHTPFSIGATKHGGGIHFLSDIFGIFANQQAYLQYAYKMTLGDGILSFGTNLGFINIICYGDSVRMADSDYHTANDPLVPVGMQSGVNFDMALGAQYYTPTWHLGFSVAHLTSPKITLGDNLKFGINPLYTLYGGYYYQINSDFKLKPGLLIATDLRSWTFNGTLIVDYKEKFWGGLGYRLEDAVSLMFGVEIFKGFNLGYTFDLPTNAYIVNSAGSHELFLSYEFSLIFGKKDRTYKSIRIL